jgi:hypothetical protein
LLPEAHFVSPVVVETKMQTAGMKSVGVAHNGVCRVQDHPLQVLGKKLGRLSNVRSNPLNRMHRMRYEILIADSKITLSRQARVQVFCEKVSGVPTPCAMDQRMAPHILGEIREGFVFSP